MDTNINQQFDFESGGYIPLAPVDEIIERSKLPKEVVVYERKAEVVEYAPKASSPINYKEAGRSAVFIGVMAGVVYVGYVAIVAFAAWIASNIAVIGCAGIGCFIIWAFASNKEAAPGEYGSRKTGTSGTGTGGTIINNYYQYNNFGGTGSNEQNNMK